MLCSKNIGRVHTKWSPVSVAAYRLLPDIELKVPVLNEDVIIFVIKVYRLRN